MKETDASAASTEGTRRPDITPEQEAAGVEALNFMRKQLGEYLSDETLVCCVFDAMRAAPAAPAAQEPVAEVIPDVVGVEIAWLHPSKKLPVGSKLYAAPAAEEPVKSWSADLSSRIAAFGDFWQAVKNGNVNLAASCAAQVATSYRTPDVSKRPLEPTPAMIEAGAQRLVSWEDGCEWPRSWDALQVRAARNDAERVWRSMWLAAAPEAPK